MSYPKTKAERYANFGGINTKVSRYQTDQQQVIKLINYDFSNPGALTKRPGFQYFGGASYGNQINELYSFQRLSGASYNIVYGTTGLFFSGDTSSILFPLVYPGASYNANFGLSTGVNGTVGATLIPDFVSMNDMLYIAANPFYNVWQPNYFLPYQPNEVFPVSGWGVTIPTFKPSARPVLPTVLSPVGATFASYSSYAATLSASYGYRWYLSSLTGSTTRPIYGGAPFDSAYLQNSGVLIARNWRGLYNYGATYYQLNLLPPINQAVSDGASYLLVYRQQLGYTANVLNQDVVPLTTAIFQIPVTDTTGMTMFRDYGQDGGVSYCLGLTAAGAFVKHDYLPFASSISTRTDGTFVLDEPKNLEASSPEIAELFNNMVLTAGFPTNRSRIRWSNLGFPEYNEPENYADIRTDDGDVITCVKAYGTECPIGKRNSFHSLTGTDPDSIAITLKSTQYGILAKRAACTWENLFWFLDRKGIVEYNGANFQVVSTPVEDIFKRMNFDWAQQIAIVSHQKMRNEIWCCIPIDGATYNNIVVVYDYVAKAWSTFEGVNASALIATALTMPFPQPTIGASGGRMAQMGITHFADFGGVYTTGVRFPFVTNYGWSVQQVFRRLFVDTDPVIGQNRTFLINLYGDMLNNASYTLLSVFGATFQYRTDFGMYCKSMSVEIFEATTFALKLNGYTVESRFQRNV